MGHLVDYRDNYYDLNAFSTTFYNFSRKVVRAYFFTSFDIERTSRMSA